MQILSFCFICFLKASRRLYVSQLWPDHPSRRNLISSSSSLITQNGAGLRSKICPPSSEAAQVPYLLIRHAESCPNGVRAPLLPQVPGARAGETSSCVPPGSWGHFNGRNLPGQCLQARDPEFGSQLQLFRWRLHLDWSFEGTGGERTLIVAILGTRRGVADSGCGYAPTDCLEKLAIEHFF